MNGCEETESTWNFSRFYGPLSATWVYNGTPIIPVADGGHMSWPIDKRLFQNVPIGRKAGIPGGVSAVSLQLQARRHGGIFAGPYEAAWADAPSGMRWVY